MAHQEHNHGHDAHHGNHGHHGHHDHGHGHHEEPKGFFYSLSNNDAAGGFVVVYTILALCAILWLVTH